MFKVWGKLIKDNRIQKSYDIMDDSKLGFEEKRDHAFEEICYHFDLSAPIWLKKHTNEFVEFNRATFYQEDFVESIDFDRLEFDLVTTDEKK